MPSIMAVMNLAILHRTAPKDSSIMNTTAPRKISFKALIYPQPKGQITLLLWSRHRRHFSRSQSHCHSHCDRSSSFRRHTSHSSSHQSHSCCPLANGYSHQPSCHDINRHSCTHASDDAWGAQLLQGHDGQELPMAFLSHTFIHTQWKCSTMQQEAYGIYYVVTKWNYYLQGSDIVVHNDCKPLQNFLNGKMLTPK